jgi:ribose-phosphate pyrophosphokinase
MKRGDRLMGAVHGDIKIFGGSTGKVFAQKMCEYLGITPGVSEVIKFSDGNLFVKAGETVRDKDVYLVLPIGLNPNEEFTELLFWMDAFKRASASSVTAIIPYFGYAKGDRVTGNLGLKLLPSLPSREALKPIKH